MNKTLRTLLLLLLPLAMLAAAPGQTVGQPESVWINAPAAAFGGNELFKVSVMANSATPIQGFSFKLAYDPACLAVQNTEIRLAGLANMSMKQPTGAVEGIYTSTQPLQANGAMVEVAFTGLKPCDTQVALESASLLMLDDQRMATEVEGIGVDNSLLPVSYGNAPANPAAAQSIAILDDPNADLSEQSANPVLPTATTASQGAAPAEGAAEQAPAEGAAEQAAAGTLVPPTLAAWSIALLAVLLIAIIAVAWRLLAQMLARGKAARAQSAVAAQANATPTLPTPARANAGIMDQQLSSAAPVPPKAQTRPAAPAAQATLLPAGSSAFITIQRGIQAGTRIRLANFPCSLGNSPANDVALEDPSIAAFHAKIYQDKNGFTLVDLGNAYGTTINGRFYQNQLVPLAPGDVIKIGSIIMTFTVQ